MAIFLLLLFLSAMVIPILLIYSPSYFPYNYLKYSVRV